jgi:hypothetical protein
MLYFNITLPSTLRSSKWSFPIMSLIHTTCLVHPFSLIWSPKQCFVRCTDHNPPRFAVFTTPLLGPNITLGLCSSLNVRPSYGYGTRLLNMYPHQWSQFKKYY